MRAIVEHDLVPHPRLVHGRRQQAFDPRTQRYFANRDALAYRLMEKRPAESMPGNRRLACDVVVWLTHNRKPDADNLLKTVFDALQVARWVENDRMIRRASITVWDGCEKPSVAVRLSLLGADESAS